MNKFKTVKEAIILTANYYNRTLSEVVLAMYCEDLAETPSEKVVAAYHAWRKNPANTYFPLPSQILGMINPQIDENHVAREIAARINGAAVKFGYTNPEKAREFIGEIGWAIIDRRGGWNYLCSNLGTTIDPTTFEAQIREQAKATVKYGDDGMSQAIAIAGGSQRERMQSIGEIMKAFPIKSIELT